MTRILNSLLLAALAAGIYSAIRERQLNGTLRQEHQQLTEQFGRLDIQDRTKMHLIALKSNEPHHYRWRVFLPKGMRAQWNIRGKRNSRNFNSAERDFILQVRLRHYDGRLNVFIGKDMGSSLYAVGSKETGNFLIDRMDQLHVQQLGKDKMVVLDPNEVHQLIDISMPQAMEEEAKRELRSKIDRMFLPLVYRVELGSERAFADQQAKAATQ